MPTYEFECECDNVEEIYIQRIIRDEEKERICSVCGKIMEIVLYSPNMKINDADHGWYIQDRGFNNEKPEYNLNLKRRKKQNEKITT